MEKKILLLIMSFVLFNGCNKEIEKKTSVKIIKNFNFSNSSRTKSLFKCIVKDERNTVGRFNTNFTKSNILELKCINQMKNGVEIVGIKINNKLEILKVTYSYDSYDTVGENEEIYIITNSEMILNKNPFVNKYNGFKGEVSLTGEVEIKSNSLFESSSKEKFSFSGYFVCE